MSAVPHFGPLGVNDSLVARMERLWEMKPSVVEITFGFVNPHDDSLIDWGPKLTMSRADAANALRTARQQGQVIERSVTGYEITGGLNKAWRYTS